MAFQAATRTPEEVGRCLTAPETDMSSDPGIAGFARTYVCQCLSGAEHLFVGGAHLFGKWLPEETDVGCGCQLAGQRAVLARHPDAQKDRADEASAGFRAGLEDPGQHATAGLDPVSPVEEPRTAPHREHLQHRGPPPPRRDPLLYPARHHWSFFSGGDLWPCRLRWFRRSVDGVPVLPSEAGGPR